MMPGLGRSRSAAWRAVWLLLLVWISAFFAGLAHAAERCLTFFGDVSLSRGVGAALDRAGSTENPFHGLAEDLARTTSQAPAASSSAASIASPTASIGVSPLAGSTASSGAAPIASGIAPSIASPTRRPSDAWVANLEGCRLPDDPQSATCRNVAGLCLGIAPRHLQVLKGAPFAALSVENNHSQDFGPAAAAATRWQLRALGILPLHEASPPAGGSSPVAPPTDRAQKGSPRVVGLCDSSDEAGSVQWLTQGDVTWGLVAVNLINRTSAEVDATLLRARLRIGLARARTPWVAVLPHWGREYDAQGGRSEWELSERFARWGARLVVGSHPHVIGDRRCGPTVAAYYSLGNLLFDQPQPATQRGLALRCCVRDATQLDCRGFQTVRPPGSLWPRLAEQDPQQACRLDLRPPQAGQQTPPTPSGQAPDTAWLRHPKQASLLFVQPFRSLGPQHFFALRRLYSRFDDEQALRPYVFAMKEGRVVDVWRGTALSWPLLFARLLQLPDGRERLCALHRGDSFVRRDPQIPASRRFHAVYAWSGFGFARVDDAEALALCQQH